ncbi:MAG: Mov34/MPN/PAD-1 family protein [Candidatus Bathyarchaeota archaeon]|nr:Mov34/MPN/PAD-1 family protein [Candidatus Bathyarchaeum tardum]WGM89442.1 MAG: Mov34/MPN/PAD-1 family protein [Candidatus Bathyarchaeum tardum]WNZ28281.1 MAG: Mov34/MPN/PAD-1 family protein [Candidatus Bathyarchaeota archaeon]
MTKEILIEKTVVDSILSYAQMCHPKESILLLKGKTDRKKIIINDVQIPPLATHGNTFSGFPLSRLPIDFSVIGVAHSHPSGVLCPSPTDLNHFYGKLMLITGFPYQTEQHIVVLDRNGNNLEYNVV